MSCFNVIIEKLLYIPRQFNILFSYLRHHSVPMLTSVFFVMIFISPEQINVGTCFFVVIVFPPVPESHHGVQLHKPL